MIGNDSWKTRGACNDADPELFYHPDNERGADARARDAAAQRICAACPVISECATDGLLEEHGIWGGLTERQRRKIRRSS